MEFIFSANCKLEAVSAHLSNLLQLLDSLGWNSCMGFTYLFIALGETKVHAVEVIFLKGWLSHFESFGLILKPCWDYVHCCTKRWGGSKMVRGV